jgi:hypothetical protein
VAGTQDQRRDRTWASSSSASRNSASCCGRARQPQVPAELHSDGLPGVLTLRRDIVFKRHQNTAFTCRVTTELSWNTWHLGYEYDFLYRDRWYAGVVGQAKVTDIQATEAGSGD